MLQNNINPQVLARKANVDEATANQIINDCNDNDIHIITNDDKRYPTSMKHLKAKKAPAVIYCKGDPNIFNSAPNVAVIGTRDQLPEISKNVFRQLVGKLTKKGNVIVSGLATGCDTIASESALANGGKTYVWLSNGLAAPVYPPKNQPLADRIVANGGALVSTYPPRTGMYYEQGNDFKDRLVERDYWQAASSDAVVPLAANAKSGTSHAVRAASAKSENRHIAVINYRHLAHFFAKKKHWQNANDVLNTPHELMIAISSDHQNFPKVTKITNDKSLEQLQTKIEKAYKQRQSQATKKKEKQVEQQTEQDNGLEF